MEHAILEVVSDCDVESWRHLLKDFGLTKVFQYGVPSLGLPTMDLWSGTSEIRDRCFLLLLGSPLVPKDTCVSFIQSISHVRPAPQLFCFWRINPSRRHLFWCWKRHLHYLRDRLWHSTSFWTWSPRWSATTPCASWVSGMPEKGSPLAVLWLLKTEDVLMKIDGLVIVYCYALTVTIVWVEHGSTSMESQSPCSFQS